MEIKAILEMAKPLPIVIIPTKKNRETRFRYGITVEYQESLVRELKEENYHSGPDSDEDVRQKEPIWVFKVHDEEVHLTFYIKFCIKKYPDKDEWFLNVISCHIDNI
jgi:hypothetical protein